MKSLPVTRKVAVPAMESLMIKDPGINVVYTINEPAAAGRL